MLSSRLLPAIQITLEAHGHQFRKTTSIPYICHPLGVCSLVMEYGGDVDDQIAALFHDFTEDTSYTLEYIEENYGKRVAELVDFCSEKFERLENGEKPHWKERKINHINELKELTSRELTDVEQHGLLVKAADMVHNARSTLQDVRAQGDAAYEKFNGGKAGRLWYMREVTRQLNILMSGHPIIFELKSIMESLDDIELRVSSILQLSVHGHDLYYDASTAALRSRAFLNAFLQAHSVFELFGDIEDDYTIERFGKEIIELETMAGTLRRGNVPNSLTYGISEEVRKLPKLRKHVANLMEDRRLFLLALQNDASAAEQLLERRIESIDWKLIDLQPATD
jgi:hypothetical protein